MIETIAPLIINGLTGAAGFCAIAIYLVQKRNERANAAIMVAQQIDLINQETINIRSKMNGRTPSFTYLYELPPLMQINYWEKYKHLFIKYLSSKQINEIDNFYRSASVIVEQQALIKETTHSYYEEVQRNTLDFSIHNAKLEYSEAINSQQLPQLIEQMVEMNQMTKDQASLIKQIVGMYSVANINDINNIVNAMTNKHQSVSQVIERTLYAQVPLFYGQYIPMQVNDFLIKALDTTTQLSITKSRGYDVLNGIGRRHLFAVIRGRLQSK